MSENGDTDSQKTGDVGGTDDDSRDPQSERFSRTFNDFSAPSISSCCW